MKTSIFSFFEIGRAGVVSPLYLRVLSEGLFLVLGGNWYSIRKEETIEKMMTTSFEVSARQFVVEPRICHEIEILHIGMDGKVGMENKVDNGCC